VRKTKKIEAGNPSKVQEVKKTEENEKKMRNDVILIVILLAVVLLIYIGLRVFPESDNGTAAVLITVDGAEYGRYLLAEDATVQIELPNGEYNILIIQDGTADMTEASCPDKICVNHRAISRQNESIICLPNKVVVTIENGEPAELDAVAQ
jgi:hypothetical protein